MASSSACASLFLSPQFPCFLGSNHSLLARERPCLLRSSPQRSAVRASAGGGWNWTKALGGRGPFMEEVLKTEEKAKELLFSVEAREVTVEEKFRLTDVLGKDFGSFDKEAGGLTGGFPGGEMGVKDFLTAYPLPPKPPKLSKVLQNTQKQLSLLSANPPKPAVIPPPLLMPGMTVRVVNKKDPYFMFTGIVQRITDGKVGVLFEGGNWDKLVTFALTDLERSAKGPPMSNPKSAVLEELVK
eukprot:TRINITY_DN446_c0_g1_i1.p1 TRINITY_DN446_c0_g1~~TRINITY_DN446_c0_g1_i1.p1  ORF type:complete len:269 (-),score=65.16 TRINITY_DN446_c0_g1_i1:368-1093(-)